MDMFVLAAVAILAAMAGFWAGRSIQWQLAEAAEAGSGEEYAAPSEQPVGPQTKDSPYSPPRVDSGTPQPVADAFPRVGQLTEPRGMAYGMVGTAYEMSYGMPRPAESAVWVRAYAESGVLRADLSDGRADAGRRVRRGRRSDRRRQVKTVSLGREIGSPVAGQMGIFVEDGRQKLRLLPDQGKVYAPASGRIQRLYPMGRAMLLHTEFGADLLLQAGSGADEMCSGFYHCRVMEHEYVRKGTLLLEYDPAGIRGEGASPEVILSIENEGDLGGVTVMGQGRVKVGETILYIACGRHSESYEKLS
ncbi:MAG: PTS glucose transporter subunit IIA [Muribaculum sp.]|nr:PTS glucose transporter subunit IIA [Muribaculum sp.]